jgi:hypothetical protein
MRKAAVSIVLLLIKIFWIKPEKKNIIQTLEGLWIIPQENLRFLMKIGLNFPLPKSVLKQISRNLSNRSGKFRVNHLFYLKWHQGGLVLAGEILEGFVKGGGWAKILVNEQVVLRQIQSVEFVDVILGKESWVGLTFKCDSEEFHTLWKDLDIKNQVVEVFCVDD